MRIVDANVLLYAVNRDAPRHDAARTWLDRSLAGADTVGLSWIVLLAFLRISTKIGLFPYPLSVEAATDQVGRWLDAPGGRVVSPGGTHLVVLHRLLQDTGSAGNLVNDAHLAALAIEHRADIVSYDVDFSRFDITWCRPDDLLSRP